MPISHQDEQLIAKVTENFLNYVSIDTQSMDDAETFPSTSKQFQLADVLYQEMLKLQLTEITYDKEHCYLYATIPATCNQPEKVSVIGFISHMDTSPAVSGENVHPQIVRDYNGQDIDLHKDGNYILSPKEYPEILKYLHQDLIVTDGTTLLGADDKSGVAEIMTMAEYLMKHQEILHGKIRIAFTPDEEVGRGVDYFDTSLFAADYAYTVDGGALGEIEYENFNAASARLVIYGKSIHPGDAKNKMKNAVLLANEFMSLLPASETPATTQDYEGFYHADSIQGNVEKVTIDYIIRDHDKDCFEKRKKRFQGACDYLNYIYGENTFKAEIKDSYYNMKEKILPHFHLIENAKKAMECLDIEVKIVPIRGGTDGARLSYMGLPCPNLSTGGHNFHGRYEYICIQSMQKMVQVLLEIVAIYTKN